MGGGGGGRGGVGTEAGGGGSMRCTTDPALASSAEPPEILAPISTIPLIDDTTDPAADTSDNPTGLPGPLCAESSTISGDAVLLSTAGLPAPKDGTGVMAGMGDALVPSCR